MNDLWFLDGLLVAIVGSREYPRPEFVRRFVRELPTNCTMISGGAQGVDRWAEETARARNLKVVIYPADWDKHGKRAGMLRNETIVIASDVVVAFWDGLSKGTAHTMERARTWKRSLLVFGDDGRLLRAPGKQQMMF